MPPRYAYWTILIDGQATAFRAREREELLPTFNQLARKNADITMRYFARGRLWDNPEQAQWANRNRPTRPGEPRDRDWRPGGEHKDPRARFEKPHVRDRGAFQSKESKPFPHQDRKPFQRRERKPFRPDTQKFRDEDRRNKRPEDLRQRQERPKWQPKSEHPTSKPNDRHEPRFDARATKRPGGWRRSPKRKPR